MRLDWQLIHEILKFSESHFPVPKEFNDSLITSYSAGYILYKVSKKKGTYEKINLSYKDLEPFKNHSWEELYFHYFMLGENGCLDSNQENDIGDFINISRLTWKGHELLTVLEGRDVPRLYFFK